MSLKKDLHNIRDRLINITIITSVVFVIIALVPSLIRYYEIGWQPIYGIHIGVTLVILFLVIGRNQIPLEFKAHSFFILFLIISLAGLVNFKIASGVYIALAVITISAVMYGSRISIIYSVVFIMLFAIIAYLHVNGILKSVVDFNQYLNNNTTWIASITGYIFTIIILISTINLFYKYFIDALNKSETRAAELLKTMESLELSKNRYLSIFEGSRDGFLFVNERFRIIKCNESYLNLIGYSFDEINGMDYKSLLNKKNFDWDSYLIGLTEKQENKTEIELVHKSGEIIPAEVSVYKVDYNDTSFLWAVVRDLREKKALENKIFTTMIRSEESERERYAKELHDGLGPLLATSMIYVHAIKDEMDINLTKDYSDRAYTILKDATRTVKEISNNLSPIILNEYGVAQAVRSFIEKIQQSTNIKFTIDNNIDGSFTETVQFTIYRIITELINNSIKYSEATNVKIAFQHSNGELNVSYNDNGKGFDYKETLSENKGFGLLNLENRVRKLGGEYAYSSAKGEGVNVSIVLKAQYV